MCNLAAAMTVSTGGYSGWLCNQNTPKSDICTWQGVTCSASRVTVIGFYDCYFLGTIPTSLGGLLKLQTLNLRYNQLVGPIPTSFGGLSSLSYLSFYSNCLVGAIPSTLCALQKLSYLNTLGNKFSCFPSCLLSVPSNNYAGYPPQCV